MLQNNKKCLTNNCKICYYFSNKIKGDTNMKKKLMIGALALSATAVFGLTGCDGESPDKPKVPQRYTVTFDHDNDTTTAPVDVLEFTEGDQWLSGEPAAPEVDGFAGIWNAYTLEDENITVTAHYGDGSEINPYMVANESQFKRIIDDYTKYVDTTYTTEAGEVVEEAQAVIKSVNYRTVSLVYTRATTEDDWEFDRYDSSNKVYFKLINDISLSQVSELNTLNLSGRYFAGSIDGQGFGITSFDGSLFVNTYGAMFDNIVDTTFKNLNVYLGDNLGSLAAHARGGDNAFENITIHNSGEKATFVSVDDTNESPFIFHALGDDTTLTFRNCINKANMVISADYCGLFLGGYAKNIRTLTFSGCVNEGNIKSSGSVGMLIGNGTYSPAELVVDVECKNWGTVAAKKESHILVSYAKGSGMIADKIAEYDTQDRLTNYESQVIGRLLPLETQYEATIEGANITVTNKTAEESIATGDYQLILSAYASNKTGANHMSLLTNIVIKANVEEGENFTFENAFYGMMDLNTYNNATLNNDKVDVTTLEDADWTMLEGYNARYFVDAENGIYVIDFSQVEEDCGITDNKLVINRTAAQLNKVIVVYNAETKDIDFIADFN